MVWPAYPLFAIASKPAPSWISKARKQVGRKKLSPEVRELIFRMMAENPTWGAPRIHGELLMLGLQVSERSVSRWMKRVPRDPQPAQRWRAFLRNHREAIAAMDFFTVPTISFGVLYCFFVIRHDRRRILHFNITKHPTSGWIIQQLREAFPFETAPRFLIHDRDAKYGTEIQAAIRSLQIKAVRTSFESPWQNGVAERWVGSYRRELLDHVIALNERHLRRLLSEYVSYHNRASYCPPSFVVENSKPFCCDVGIAGSRLLRRTRSTNLAAERWRSRSSSYSFKLPFKPNSKRSLLCRGVYTVSWSISTVSTTRHTSINCCHSRLFRANRETSRAATAPTWPKQTSATIRSKPARVTVPAADRPKSSSTTSISRQPSCRRRSSMAYCNFWLSKL